MAILLALASSACWGTSDFFGGLFTRRIHPIKTVVISQTGGLIATLIAMLVLAARGSAHVSAAGFGWGALSGAVGCIGLITFYAALSTGTMGVVSPIAALGALVPVVLGVLGGDRITTLLGVGMVLALIGVVLASGPELSGDVSRLPVILAGIAAVCFGASLYCLHHASQDGVVPGLLAMRLASVLLGGIVWAFMRSRMPRGEVRGRDLVPLMVVGCGDLGANALFAAASTLGMVSLVSILGSLYPVATILLARGVLHERLMRVQWVGVVLALAGVAFVAS